MKESPHRLNKNYSGEQAASIECSDQAAHDIRAERG